MGQFLDLNPIHAYVLMSILYPFLVARYRDGSPVTEITTTDLRFRINAFTPTGEKFLSFLVDRIDKHQEGLTYNASEFGPDLEMFSNLLLAQIDTGEFFALPAPDVTFGQHMSGADNSLSFVLSGRRVPGANRLVFYVAMMKAARQAMQEVVIARFGEEITQEPSESA